MYGPTSVGATSPCGYVPQLDRFVKPALANVFRSALKSYWIDLAGMSREGAQLLPLWLQSRVLMLLSSLLLANISHLH